jgi:phosphoribosylformimino-5-aminoimidazole carboxamide ribotide isomerase
VTVEVIPAVDLMGGRCVRLRRGDFGDVTVYDDDPSRRAADWAAAGARRIHVVDLDAARGAGTNREIVARIVRRAGVEVQVAGGVRDAAAVDGWLSAGAAAVVMGTAAIRDPDALAAAAASHPGRVLAALDVRDGRPAVSGWSETAPLAVSELIAAWNRLDLAGVAFTSIDRDGTMAGMDLQSVREIVRASVHPVTCSGGVRDIDDVRAAARAGASALILGRALYEGRVGLGEAMLAAAAPG